MNQPSAAKGSDSANRIGPGTRLQAARIAAGLTIDDVASKMRLSPAILASLEENDFDEITAPIFVKGYLRSYARIVNVDEGEIIAEYTAYATHGDPPITSTSNTSPEINSSDSRVKLVTRLVVFVLIALLAVWWWNRYQQSSETVSLDGSEPAADEITPMQPEVAQNPADDLSSEIESLPPFSQPEPAEDAVVAVINQQMQENDNRDIEARLGDTMNDQPVEMEAPADDGQEAMMTLQTELGTAVDRPEEELPALLAEPVAAEPVEVSDAGQGLVVSVVADTWADIRDADGNKLVYDLLRAGRSLEVEGKTPINVFLGNGYGASLSYQGNPVDLTGSIRPNNTARISIGE